MELPLHGDFPIFGLFHLIRCSEDDDRGWGLDLCGVAFG